MAFSSVTRYTVPSAPPALLSFQLSVAAVLTLNIFPASDALVLRLIRPCRNSPYRSNFNTSGNASFITARVDPAYPEIPLFRCFLYRHIVIHRKFLFTAAINVVLKLYPIVGSISRRLCPQQSMICNAFTCIQLEVKKAELYGRINEKDHPRRCDDGYYKRVAEKLKQCLRAMRFGGTTL